eukprot:gene4866-biopygen12576
MAGQTQTRMYVADPARRAASGDPRCQRPPSLLATTHACRQRPRAEGESSDHPQRPEWRAAGARPPDQQGPPSSSEQEGGGGSAARAAPDDDGVRRGGGGGELHAGGVEPLPLRLVLRGAALPRRRLVRAAPQRRDGAQEGAVHVPVHVGGMAAAVPVFIPQRFPGLPVSRFKLVLV